MPKKAPTPCRHHGCSQLLEIQGYCDEHKRESIGWMPDAQRGTRQQRGYGAMWQKKRKRILQRDNGMCQPCRRAGRVKAASHVDHIVNKASGGTLTDIQRAARFYYLQQNCFGGKLEGQTFGTATTTPPGLNLLRLKETLSAAHLRLSSTFVELLDWKTCIDKYDWPHTLFYMDTPYLETEGYGVPFPYTEYVEMAPRPRTLKGRAIVSLDNHPDIRRAFEGFHIEAVDVKYTVGGGGREAARKEVIIFSWNEAIEPAGLF